MEVTTSERRASGGAAPELPARNLVEAFYIQVDRRGDQMAILDEAREVELSWNELRDTVHRIAGGLARPFRDALFAFASRGRESF